MNCAVEGSISQSRYVTLGGWLLLLLAMVSVAPANGASNGELGALFESGNKAYEQGKYADAAAAYENIRHAGGSSPALLFNLGNSYLKLNQTGRAIAAYKTARQLAPRDADIRANLQFARRLVQGPTVYQNLWERWLNWFTPNEWTVAAASSAWIFFVLLAIRQFKPELKTSFRALIPIFGGATVVLVVCVLILYQDRSDRIAIVVSDVAIAHKGPLDESPAAFTIHDGAELRLLDAKEDWFQVTADSRRIGWLKRSDALLIPQS